MKKQLLTLLLTVCCLSAAADEPLKYLVIWANNGAKTTYALKDNPQVTFTDDALVVTKDGQETSFPLGSLQRFTYESIMLGDVNGDAKVDIVDVAKTINYLLSFTRSEFPVEAADFNKNGTVDSNDVDAMIELVVNGSEADIPVSSQQAAGEAFYVYRNDNDFNAFFRDEVEKLEYSNYDADGNLHDEVVSQLVNTADSVYNIPLTAIDSVGFVTPETKYKPGVINLQDGLQEYVARVNDNTITLMSYVPSDMLPHIGDKLVTTDMNEMFPIGFAGEVLDVQTNSNGVDVICGDVALEDVFDCFYGYSRTPVQSADSRKNAPWDNWEWPEIHLPDFVYHNAVTYAPEPFHRELTQGMPNYLDANFGDWSGSYQSRFVFDFVPRMWISGFVMITHDERYFSVTITGDYSLRESYSYTGKLSWSPSAGLNISAPIPVCPFLQVFIEPGLFVKAEAETSFDATFTQHYTSAFHYDWSSNGTTAMEPVFSVVPKENTASFEGYLKGELAFGAYLDIGIEAFRTKGLASINGHEEEAFRTKELARINGHAEIGLSVDGNVNLSLNDEDYTSSTLLYDMLKQSYFTGNWYWGTAFEARLTPLLTYHHDFPLGKKNELWRRGFVPSFSDVELKQCLSPSTSADANLVMTGNCVTPVEVGLSVRDQDGDEVDSYFANTTFQNGTYSLPHTFSDLTADSKYTLYPMVRLGDVEMLASPSSDMEETVFPVEITDFKVTKSQYDKGAFTNDGHQYDYRFDVSVTATLDEEEGIADWGYVYLDPNGREALISLKQFGTSYTDTRYAYFRNEAKSTCTLYGYVIYADSDEPVYGEPHDYPLEYGETSCPDANHPHWIDLGLPSGTQWRCCNEGASTPEAYGGYYTFGQVSSAPSLNQIEELLNYTTSVWTTQNGVNGRKFTGSNGGTIFLPAAGYRRVGEFYDVGEWGYCWSSSPFDDEYSAFVLYFSSDHAYWDYGYYLFGRYGKYSVRPVR